MPLCELETWDTPPRQCQKKAIARVVLSPILSDAIVIYQLCDAHAIDARKEPSINIIYELDERGYVNATL